MIVNYTTSFLLLFFKFVMAFVSFPGVDNYVVMASFLTKTFNNSLLDRTSSYFQQLSEELITFVSMIMQLSDVLTNFLLPVILNYYPLSKMS